MQYEQPGFREGPIFLHAPLPSIAASYLALEGILAALYVREVTGRGQWVETSLYQGVLAFTTQLWQDAEHRVEPWFEIGFEPASQHLRVRRRPVGALDALRRRSGQGPQHRVGDPRRRRARPRMEPDRCAGVRRRGPRRDRADEAPGPARPVLGQRDRDRAGAPRARGARGRAGDQQRHVGGGRRPAARPRAAGRHLLPGARRADAARCRVRNPRSGSTPTRCSARWRGDRHVHAPARPAKRPVSHTLEGIKILDLGNFLAGPFGPMLLGDLGATVYKLESPQGDQMRPVTQPFNGCQRGKLDVVVDLKQPEGLEIAHRLDPRGRRRAPQHAARRGRAAGRRLRDRQAAQPDRHLLPHDDVGQRRAARHLARLRPARAVVVRARAGAGRRGQRSQLVPLRHVRPGVRGAVGARGADGALLARAHRRGSAGRHVDRERWRALQHRRVDRARRQLVGAASQRQPSRPVSVRSTGSTRRATAGSRWPASGRPTGPRSRRRCPTSTTRASAIRPGALRTPTRSARCSAGSSRRAPPRTPSTCSTGPGCRSRSRRRTPGARGSTNRTSSPPGSSPTTSTRPTGASASSATSSSSRRRPAPSAGPPPLLGQHSREVLLDLGYPAEEIDQLRERGVTVWPD